MSTTNSRSLMSLEILGRPATGLAALLQEIVSAAKKRSIRISQ